MSSAFAEPLPPSRLLSRASRHVAVITADATCRPIVAPLLVGASRDWVGTVTACDVSDLAANHPDAVVLVADFAVPVGIAALRRIRGEVPGAHLVVVARDDTSGIAARQALNAGAQAFVPADEI